MDTIAGAAGPTGLAPIEEVRVGATVRFRTRSGVSLRRRGLELAAATALALGVVVAPAAPVVEARSPISVRVTGPAALDFAGSGRVRLTVQVTNRTDWIVFVQGSVTRSPGPPCDPEGDGACTPLETGSCSWYPELYPGQVADLACWGEVYAVDASLGTAVSFRVVVEARTATATPLGRVASGPIAVTVAGTDGVLDVSPQGGSSPVVVRALRPGPVDVGVVVSTGPADNPGPAVGGVEVWALVRPADATPIAGAPPAESTECPQAVGTLQGGTTSTFTCRLTLAADTGDQVVDFAARGSVGDLVVERRSVVSVVLVPLDLGAALEIREVRPRADRDLAPARPGELVGLAVDLVNRGTEDLAISGHPESAALGRCSSFADLQSGSRLDLDCRVRLPAVETTACAFDVTIVVDGTASGGTTVSSRATTTLALANPGCPGSVPNPTAKPTPPPTSTDLPGSTSDAGPNGAAIVLALLLIALGIAGSGMVLRRRSPRRD